MKLSAKPEGVMERVALLFNLAPVPLLDTQIAFNSARSIMAAAALGVFEALGEGEKTAEEIAAVSTQIQRQQNSFSIVWSESAMRVGLAVSTACDRFTANGCCAPVRTPS